jgi:hypothetical protein
MACETGGADLRFARPIGCERLIIPLAGWKFAAPPSALFHDTYCFHVGLCKSSACIFNWSAFEVAQHIVENTHENGAVWKRPSRPHSIQRGLVCVQFLESIWRITFRTVKGCTRDPPVFGHLLSILACVSGSNYSIDGQQIELGWRSNPMSALGHKRTFRNAIVMSALPLKADIRAPIETGFYSSGELRIFA